MLQNRKRVRHVRMLYKCRWCHRQMSKVTLQRTCCYCPPTDRCPSMMGIFKQIRLLPCFNRKLTQLFSEPYGFCTHFACLESPRNPPKPLDGKQTQSALLVASRLQTSNDLSAVHFCYCFCIHENSRRGSLSVSCATVSHCHCLSSSKICFPGAESQTNLGSALGKPGTTTSTYLHEDPPVPPSALLSTRRLLPVTSGSFPPALFLIISLPHTPLGLKLLPLFRCAERSGASPRISLDSANHEFRTPETITQHSLKKKKI